MEEKQLDFDRPLLSVRRIPSAAPPPPKAAVKRNARIDSAQPKLPTLPFYKSDLKSGPVSHPGTVPFVWEQTPGNPKNDGVKRRPQSQASQQPYVVPKPPPGRALNNKQETPSKTHGVVTAGGQLQADNALRSCRSVATLNDTQHDSSTTYGSVMAGVQSQNGNLHNRSRSVASSNDSVFKEESSKRNENVEECVSSGSKEEESEVYLDALDSLSRSESFFLNCSISGVSGLDDSGFKPSATMLTDPQSRDFMINRFLPAAKAMASESPQHISTKKKPVVKEQPRPIPNAVTTRPVNRGGPNYTPYYAESNAEEEGDDEEDDRSGPDYSSHNLCGLLPRLCLQNSIPLLNSGLGMKKHVWVPASPVRTVKVRSQDVASCNSQAEIERGRHGTYLKRSMVGLQMKDENMPRTELSQRSSKINCWKPDGLSLYELFQSNGALPAGNKSSERISEPSKISDDFSAHTKTGYDNDSIAKKSNGWESGSTSPVVEKTLYVDSVQIVKTRKSSLCSSDTKGSIDFEGVKGKEIEENASVRSSEENLKAMKETEKVRHESIESADSCFLSFSDRSMHDVTDGFTRDQDVLSSPSPKNVDDPTRIQDLLLFPTPKTGNHILGSSIDTRSGAHVADDRKTDLERQICPKPRIQEPSKGRYYSPLPPPLPLPKSPTESWLLRTLPMVCSKKSSSRSFLATVAASPTTGDLKKQIVDLRWETIVRTSSAEHANSRCSGELLATIPEA